MGLKGDFSELTSVWRQSPWRVKVVLVLSGFLATSSVASLAEAVAKWKGFILAGVSYYREWVTTPLAHLASTYLSLHITAPWLEGLTLVFLLAGAIVRGFWVDLRIDRSRLNVRVTYVLLFILAAFVGWAVYVAVVAPPGSSPNFRILIAGYVAIFAWTFMPPRGAWDLVVQVWLVVPLLIVGILAAINLGLS